MNELDLTRRFREEVPPPDPVQTARARAQVLAGAVPTGRSRRPQRARLRLVAIGVAALGLAVAVASGVVVRGPRVVLATAAADELRRVAGVAAARPDPGRLTPGRYWYVRSTGAVMATVGDQPSYSYLLEGTRELWVAADGSGRLRETTAGRPRFLTARDRANWVASGSPALESGTTDERFRPGGLSPGATVGDGSYESLLALPTDPDKLFEHFHQQAAGHARGTEVEMFVLVSDALRETPAPLQLQAALYEVAARIKGVNLVRRATDPAGRPGAVVWMVDREGMRHELYFDPATATPLGEREVVERAGAMGGLPKGTVVGYSSTLAAGVVGSVTARLTR